MRYYFPLEEDIISSRRKRSRDSGFQVPKRLVVYGVVAFCIFIVAGGIYNILENPPTLIPGPGGRWITLHPYATDQTLYESVFVMITYTMMFAGMLLAYRSTKVAYNRRRANYLLIIGIGLVLAGYSGNWLILFMKRALL